MPSSPSLSRKYLGPLKLSLGQRLFLSATVVLVITLWVTGLVLDQAFSISLDNFVREKLRIHTFALLSSADNVNNKIQLPMRLPEQQFNATEGSLLALVTDTQQSESWRSLSAGARRFSLPLPDAGEWLFGRAQDSTGEIYYVSSYSTTWPGTAGKKTAFVFTVMESVDVYRQQLADYRGAIAAGLIGFGLMLLTLQSIVLRWGLRYLREVAMDVSAMNMGELQSLTGRYPKELQPLTANLNQLIKNERLQRERYRDRMADLSHSLKTPISVLHGIASDTDHEGKPISRQQILETLQRQVSRMRNIVDHQLQRAVTTGRQTGLVVTAVRDEVDSIVSALDKVYYEKGVRAIVQIETTTGFYGDENDLLELLGNLLDNAYKHCHKQVKISGHVSEEDADTTLVLNVEDDGPGVPQAMRTTILRRGVRLDSTAEGQGLGLAIVVDIVSSYNGHISVGDSSLGGALFTLTIPNAHILEGC
jgi:two-component system sensor histidine kinase PhoQ